MPGVLLPAALRKPPPWAKYQSRTPLATGLVHGWVMNEGGGTLVRDFVQGNTLTISGTLKWTKDGWDVNNAAHALAAKQFNPSYGISVAVLVNYHTPTNGFYHIIGKHPSWYMTFNGGTEARFNINDAADAYTGGSGMSAGRYLLVGTYDRVNVKAYRDGSQYGASHTTAYTSAVNSTGTLAVGAYGGDPTSATYRFPGAIEAAYIWERGLTANEVALLATNPYQLLRY